LTRFQAAQVDPIEALRQQAAALRSVLSARSIDFAQVRTIGAELIRLAGEDRLLPAEWYTHNTRLSAGMLRAARDKVRNEKRSGRWFYDWLDCRQLWPHRWLHPRTNKPPIVPGA